MIRSGMLFSPDMASAILEKYLPRPRCESCGKGYVRPIDVMNGSVVFRCSRQGFCLFTVREELPQMRKTIVYLDTSTVSHMARAKGRKDASDPYFKLYEALRRASHRNLIACPDSTIVETEAEFSALADTIVQMSRHLSDPGLNHPLHVREAQLFRALDHWMADDGAQVDTAPPWRDAFESDIHAWHSTFNVFMNMRMPEEFTEAAKRAKGRCLPQVAEVYQAYADASLTFDQVAEREKGGYGPRLLLDGRVSIEKKMLFQQGKITDPNVMWPSTFEKIAARIQQRRVCSIDESLTAAADFSRSSYVAETPFASISGRLQAALALLCRGNAPRQPKPGDQYDIEHIATFMPYVDVFIADKGMAALANQNHLNLGESFNTKIRSLGEKEIPAFIDWLDSLAVASEVAALSERIMDSIWQGGFHQEFATTMEQEIAGDEKL